MFGECHAHVIMNGLNYRQAVDLHKTEVQYPIVRKCLETYAKNHIFFLRDGGDALGVSKAARTLAPEYGIDYRSPIFAIHKNGHYGSIVGNSFSTMKEYHQLVQKAGAEGADFIKIMTTGILDFKNKGNVTGTPLSYEEVKEMIHIAHEEGFSVMAHTNGSQAAMDVISCGVDSLEHGNFIDEVTIKMLADSHTVWVPTLATIQNLIGNGRFSDEDLIPLAQQAAENVRLAFQYHAKVAPGSDAGAYCVPHGQGLLDEIRIFHQILGDTPEIDSWLLSGQHEIQKRFIRQ